MWYVIENKKLIITYTRASYIIYTDIQYMAFNCSGIQIPGFSEKKKKREINSQIKN